MTNRIIRSLQVFKDGMVKHLHVYIQQCIQLFGIVELLGNRFLQHIHQVFLHQSLRAQLIVDVNNLLLVFFVQELIDDIHAPDISSERKDRLNIRF
ncbi:Uncharacterised protein [Segatella copri]|nr:Uncharacterised protein [Segatella copri]